MSSSSFLSGSLLGSTVRRIGRKALHLAAFSCFFAGASRSAHAATVLVPENRLPSGLLGNSNSLTTVYSLSADGTKVAFSSNAINLVSGDTNGTSDIFVRDMSTGVTTRVSTSSSGVQANNSSSNPSLSADGTKVAFQSNASNLVSGDSNTFNDIFVKDLTTGVITRASTDSSGAQANHSSSNPSLSADGTKVAFHSNAINLVSGDTNSVEDIFVKDLSTGAITRASTDSSGNQSNNSSLSPNLSADGTKVVFYSPATNLGSGDTNTTGDIFLKDLSTGVTTRVNTDSSGAQANDSSSSPSLSADGTKVAFYSYATNLVSGDTNNREDVFVKDLASGAIARVSTDSSGAQANAASSYPSLSADGTKVAFYSNANNLVSGDSNGSNDIFVKDLTTGVITRASTDSSGVQANNSSVTPSLNADGTKVAFYSSANNLVSGDTNSVDDVFVKDLSNGTTVCASVAGVPVGTILIAPANNSSNSTVFSLSADGTRVAFQSNATNLVTGDTNNSTDIFVRDLSTGVITRVSTNSSGAQGNGSSSSPSLSADGTRVAFYSISTNLVSGDTNSTYDIFVKDLGTGSITRVSTDSSGTQANAASSTPVLSADGTKVAFTSDATNLVSGDTNGQQDVFVKDLATGVTTRVSTNSSGTQGNGISTNPSLSADNTKVAFNSLANNLVSGDTNGLYDVFVKDLSTGSISRVSTDSSGAQGNNGSYNPSLSANGTKIAFYSNATNLVSGDTNGTYDVFVKDLSTGSIARVSLDGSGAQVNNQSFEPSLSADGTRVAFSSDATNLVSGDTNSRTDVFVKDLSTGSITRVSTNSSGAQSNHNSIYSSLSANGTRVAYTSDASNLVSDDTNGVRDVFVSDVVPTTISINDATVTEGNSGTVNAVFTVSLSATSVAPVTFDYVIANDTTNSSDLGSATDSDGGTPGTLTIAAGQTSGTITVPVTGDKVAEADETFFVNLSNTSGASISDSQGLGTITNDDFAPSINSVTLEAAPTSAGPFSAVAPKTNDTLRATVAASDGNNDTLYYSYVWKVGTTTRKSTFGVLSNTDSFDLSLAGNGDKGQTVSVTVSVSDNVNNTNNAPVSTTVANTAPVVKPIELTTWDGRSLLARPEVTDVDSGDSFTFTYPNTPGTEGGAFTQNGDSDGLFLYTPPATVANATAEVSNFSVSDGADSVQSTISVQLAPAPAAGLKRYSAVGASEVQGYGASDYDLNKVTYSADKAYAPLLVQNDKLGSRYPGIVLSRRAVNGFTAFEALNRSVGGQTNISLANSDGARAISLWYGPNDVLYTLVPLLINNLSTTPDGSGLNAVTTNWLTSWRPTYSGIVNSLRTANPGATVVAVGTPDLGPGLTNLVAQRLGITNPTVLGRISTAITRAVTGTTATTGEDGINATIAGLNLPYVDLAGDTDITTNGQVDSSLQYQPSDLASDGFHPNDSGYAKLATRLWRLFDTRLNHLPKANDAVKVASANTSTQGNVVGTDFEGSPLTFSVINSPAHGGVVMNANGSYTYTPDAGYTGSDSFTFVANDGTDNSNVATISLIVREDVVPTVTLSSPTTNQKILISNFIGDIISGTATDNVGVTAVRVRLGRKRGTANEYWNGTNWVAAQVLLNATITPAGDALVTWTLDGQLPPANKLDSGTYSVQASALDAAGNKSAYANGSFTLGADLVAPTLTISTPTANKKVLISGFNVSGTASDDTAVTAVKVRLSRKRGTSNEYWNGTAFTLASAYVDATVTGTTWSLGTATPPADQLDSGAYQVEAYALDAAGNKSATAKVAFSLNNDFTAPSVAITSPTSSQVIKINEFGAGKIAGTAGDNIGVTSVKLKLQRKRGTEYQYWNGIAFTATSVLFDATYNSETGTWSYDTAIPASALDAGGYTVYATAYDAAGNKTTSPSRLFNIVGTPSAADAPSTAEKSAGRS